MAIRPEDEYTNTNAADADYPEGSFKNESVAGLLDGTPFEKAWPNDIYGFLQKLLAVSGVTPSGAPDTVLASDYYDAMTRIFFNRPYRSVAISGSLLTTDGIVYVNATAGDVVLAPPSAAAMVQGGATTEITIKRIDISANKVTVSGITGEDGGEINLTGTGRAFINIASDGTNIYLTGAP